MTRNIQYSTEYSTAKVMDMLKSKVRSIKIAVHIADY